MTGWCTGQDIRNDPSAVEADQFYAGQSATNLVMATTAGAVSVSRDSLWWISDRGPIRHLAGGLGPQTVARHDRLGAAGAVSADPQVRARPGPLTGGRKWQHDTLAAVAGAEALPTKTSEH
jgi:hypothetical protein